MAPRTLSFIRPYEHRDAPRVRDLFIRVNRALAPDTMRAVFEAYILRALREEILRIPDYCDERDGSFWVMETGGTLLGIYGLERADRSSAELRRMYVAPEMRRRGIARTLLGHAEQVCREQGFRSLVLSTSELQRPALALYAAAGFSLWGQSVSNDMDDKTIDGGMRRFHFRMNLTAGSQSK